MYGVKGAPLMQTRHVVIA